MLCGQSHSQTSDSTGESLGIHIKKSFANKFMWRGPTQPSGITSIGCVLYKMICSLKISKPYLFE